MRRRRETKLFSTARTKGGARGAKGCLRPQPRPSGQAQACLPSPIGHEAMRCPCRVRGRRRRVGRRLGGVAVGGGPWLRRRRGEPLRRRGGGVGGTRRRRRPSGVDGVPPCLGRLGLPRLVGVITR